MKFTIITANKNGGRFLERTLLSVITQRESGIDLEYIVLDGGSTDDSLRIIRRYERDISRIISEPDSGPVSAINRGFGLASGEMVAWLNADDCYHEGALAKVAAVMTVNPDKAFCFGACRIMMKKTGRFGRGSPFSRGLLPPFIGIYFSMPQLHLPAALFFRRSAQLAVGGLREDMVAAWDTNSCCGFGIRGGRRGPWRPPRRFSLHRNSISARKFDVQFEEEFQAAARDAGRMALQTWIHRGVHWGIVNIYSLMSMLGKGT
jgi:glycosyltransferase involved in cell wall biosynthesis